MNMNTRLFLTTTAALAIATSAFAQSSPSSSSSTPATTQQQNSTSAATPAAPNTTPSSSAATPSDSAQSSSPSPNSAQTQAPASTGTSTSTTQAQPSSGSPTQAQTNQPPNQANTPSNQVQTNSSSSSQTQSANPPASNTNQAQSPSGAGSANTAQQPNSQQNTADRSSNTNVNASVNINDQQRTRISTSISHLNVQPLTSVNFSLSVGTAVPRDVRLQPLPAEVVEIVPQYRGYNFVLVKDEIVIVEPSSYKIVAVMPYSGSGRSTAAAPARSEQRKTIFSDRDREVVRKHATTRPVERERRTTGSTVRTEIRTGERVPEGVEIESFPDDVYRDAPSLREYRYINRDSRTYIVEPRERRIIEEID